jgi:acetyl-CoA acetyltransferase family protein
MKTPVFIVDAVRTPRARRKGKYSKIHPVDLLTYPLNALILRNNIDPAIVDDVSVGCVTQTQEQGWCIGRSAVLAAGWPITVPASTVNRLCGSGLQAIFNIASGIQSGSLNGIGVAAGVEHMTRVPMFSDTGGEASVFLTQRHPDIVQQGLACERIIKKYKFSREVLDAFSASSHKKSAVAREKGFFKTSLVGVPYTDDAGNSLVLEHDDNIRPESSVQTLSALKNVFAEGGALTAGNSSAIVDGAAAALLADEATIKKLSLKVRGEIVSVAAIGSDPNLMLTGPVAASRRALSSAGLTVDDIDLWEINEAFAPIPLLTIQELGLDPQKVNVNGGAIALGHPLGATGIILANTALDELHRCNKKYAVITMCIGLGMGIAMVIKSIR